MYLPARHCCTAVQLCYCPCSRCCPGAAAGALRSRDRRRSRAMRLDSRMRLRCVPPCARWHTEQAGRQVHVLSRGSNYSVTFLKGPLKQVSQGACLNHVRQGTSKAKLYGCEACAVLVAATAAELQQPLQQPALLLTCSRSCHSRKTLQPSFRATLSRYLRGGQQTGAAAQVWKRTAGLKVERAAEQAGKCRQKSVPAMAGSLSHANPVLLPL